MLTLSAFGANTGSGWTVAKSQYISRTQEIHPVFLRTERILSYLDDIRSNNNLLRPARIRFASMNVCEKRHNVSCYGEKRRRCYPPSQYSCRHLFSRYKQCFLLMHRHLDGTLHVVALTGLGDCTPRIRRHRDVVGARRAERQAVL